MINGGVGSGIGSNQSCTVTGLLTVCNGASWYWTPIETFLPTRFCGTRHEYEQVPPQPYSRLPLAIFFPDVSLITYVGFGGSAVKFCPWPKVE